MTRLVPVALLFAASLCLAQEPARTLGGRIVDEHGEAVGGAFVDAGGERVTSGPDGRFELQVIADEPVSLHIGAHGHYAAIHTLDGEDLDDLDGDLGPVTLVARKPGRRLLMFAGDAMLARRYFEPPDGEATLMRRRHVLEDGKAILSTIKPYVELADYAAVNLESQLSSGTLEDRLPKSVTFFSPAEFAEILEWAGFDYVALGNNHTWDYQSRGLSETFAALGRTGLGYSGAGFDEATARAPWKTALDGQAYAFLSYVGWAGTFSPHQAAEGSKGGAALGGSEVFAEDLAKLPSATTTVLQYHAGLEYSDHPAMSERTRLREAVDAGADIAIGHHAHILQGIELYGDRLIAYSMGNFLFDQTYYTTQLGMLLYVWMDGDTLFRAEVVPMYVNGYVPTPATGAVRRSILHRIARLSQPLGTCMQPNAAHVVAVRCRGAAARSLDLGNARPGRAPVPLAMLGAHPAEPVSVTIDGFRYRLGTDILRRGDFESAGLFGTPRRGWILDDRASIERGESRHLRITVPDGKAVRSGMSVFQRVFTPSSPTTLSGRIRASGPAVVRFQLQRRRPGTSASDALRSGPTRTVGVLRAAAAGWQRFSFDFDQPRIATVALRLLIDVADDPDHAGGVDVLFDDLTWIEWRTPWLDDASGTPDFGTHVQFRPAP